MIVFVQQLYNALAVSAIYVAVALGITMIYGLTRTVNFSHGQLLTLGAFLSYALVSNGVPYGVAIVLVMVLVALASAALDLVFFRRTLDNPLNGFVVSLGLIVALQALFVLIWSTGQYQVEAPFRKVWVVSRWRFDSPRLLTLAVTAVAVIVLFVFLERTKAGRGIRALAESNVLARLMGVPVGVYITIIFLIGGALAGMAGGLLASTYPFTAYFGFDFVLKGFAVTIIGGLGNVRGAVITALILAVVETIGSAYFALEWAPAFGLAATALIIVFRPKGLFRGSDSGVAVHFRTGELQSTLHTLEIAAARIRGAVGATRRSAWARLAVPASVALVLLVVPRLASEARTLSVATNMVILALAGYAFWFPFRYGGIFSVASAALMASGAYGAAICGSRWHWSFWLQIPFAMVVAGLVALAIGLVAMRTSSSYFVILTLVFSQLVLLIARNWVSVTNGAFGIVRPSAPDPIGPISFESDEAFYYLTVAFLAGVVAVLWSVSRTDFARRLVAVRENDMLARSLGVNVTRDKIVVFVLGGMCSGLAGALLFYYLRFVEPGTFSIESAIDVQLVVLLGGAAVWAGPVVGAAVFAFLPEVLDLSPVQARLANGLVLIAVITWMPLGLAGMVKKARLVRMIRGSDRKTRGGSDRVGPSIDPASASPTRGG